MKKLIMLIPATLISAVLVNPFYRDVAVPKNKIQESYILVEKTSKYVSVTQDPIWNLSIVSNGSIVKTFETVSGRSYRQNENRHISGNKSPLPVGNYKIETNLIERGPFSDAELGTGYWIPILPLFPTGRSSLGLHQDPSWGKINGESGTSGCIGFKSAQETEDVVNLIRQYQIKTITVKS